MVEPRPIQRPHEKMLAFYNRVSEWEERVKPLMAREARSIDAVLARAPITTRGPIISRETARSRITLHDYAQNNEVLRRILRKHPELC